VSGFRQLIDALPHVVFIDMELFDFPAIGFPT
jgi:hypothetical protein